MLFLMVLLFVLGFFLEWIEISYIALPMFLPVFMGYGTDMVWLAILVALNPVSYTHLDVYKRQALPCQVAIELRAVDRQLAADLGNRAVMAAEQFEVAAEGIGHMAAPADANDAILASTRIRSPRPAKLPDEACITNHSAIRPAGRIPIQNNKRKSLHARSSQ